MFSHLAAFNYNNRTTTNYPHNHWAETNFQAASNLSIIPCFCLCTLLCIQYTTQFRQAPIYQGKIEAGTWCCSPSDNKSQNLLLMAIIVLHFSKHYLQLCEHLVINEILRKSKQIGHRSRASTFCRWEKNSDSKKLSAITQAILFKTSPFCMDCFVFAATPEYKCDNETDKKNWQNYASSSWNYGRLIIKWFSNKNNRSSLDFSNLYSSWILIILYDLTNC